MSKEEIMAFFLGKKSSNNQLVGRKRTRGEIVDTVEKDELSDLEFSDLELGGIEYEEEDDDS